jgi:plasmid stabilization system protein ParE
MSRKSLRLHPEVPDDLKEIIDYLTKKAGGLGLKFGHRFRAALTDLRRHPGHGSIKALKIAAPETRSWSIQGFRNYLILYRIGPNVIRIVAVAHGARDLDELLKDRE